MVNGRLVDKALAVYSSRQKIKGNPVIEGPENRPSDCTEYIEKQTQYLLSPVWLLWSKALNLLNLFLGSKQQTAVSVLSPVSTQKRMLAAWHQQRGKHLPHRDFVMIPTISRWWFQPIWKILPIWIISPRIGVNFLFFGPLVLKSSPLWIESCTQRVFSAHCHANANWQCSSMKLIIQTVKAFLGSCHHLDFTMLTTEISTLIHALTETIASGTPSCSLSWWIFPRMHAWYALCL